MPTAETIQFIPPLAEEHEPIRKVASFETAKGSVYAYDEDGKTTRFKPAAVAKGENPQNERQDVTVFTHLTSEANQKILDAIHSHSDDPAINKKVYVLERQPDNRPRIIRDIAQVKDPEEVYLGIMQNGQLLGSTKATIYPELGANAFDTRQYREDGKTYTERHLGNVVKINYEE